MNRLAQECSRLPVALGSSFEVPTDDVTSATPKSADAELEDLRLFVLQALDETFVPIVLVREHYHSKTS